ncbi:hypothetical protein BU17DRAFT_71149 [Hysterangium stoloniferum]|nr:hypothetical protein BU17DRAFT_71149 [Hysterangium stoloniferum]
MNGRFLTTGQSTYNRTFSPLRLLNIALQHSQLLKPAMHPTPLHPFSTFTIQGNGDATCNANGVPLQTTTDTTRYAFPSHHTMTVTPSNSAMRDPSGYVDDTWSCAQTDGERISHSMTNGGFFGTVQPEGTNREQSSTWNETIPVSDYSSLVDALQPKCQSRAIIRGSPNPNRLCYNESMMNSLNDVYYPPALANNTSSTVYPDHAGETHIFVGDYSRTSTCIHPSHCASPPPGALRCVEVQTTFLASGNYEKQSASIGSFNPPDKSLVDGIYSSAGQNKANLDLRPSWEGELHPTPYGGRNDRSEPNGESSAGPMVTPQGLTSPPPKCPSYSTAKPSPSAFPPHCPWGGIYLSDGNKYRCMYTLDSQSDTQILEHWAREHVANEIFAFRTGVITEWDQACFLNTPQKLWNAISDLGICPNEPCVGEVFKATGDREEMIHSHLLKHPECEPAFTVPPNRGYMDMAAQLGYDDPR